MVGAFFVLGERMTEKKTQSKRANGTAKGKPARAETNKITTKAPKPSPIPPGEHITPMLTDEEIASQAYALWESRGRPLGSPEEDWYKAKEQLGASAQ
jgi:hypothetical protein